MKDCTIYVREYDPTLIIKQDTLMEWVIIICKTKQVNCMQLTAGHSLDIFTADISGNKKGRFIEMGAGASLEFRNVTGYGFGRTNLNGGFIYHPSGSYKVTIRNSRVKNNQASYGGALRIDGTGELTVHSTLFENNLGTYHGGAIYSSGNGVRTRAIWSIHNSIFNRNTATNHYAGAIYAYAITATVADTKFTTNTAGSRGGAFYLQASTFSFECSLFRSNTITKATTGGGAVYATSSSKMMLMRTMFLNNKCKTTISDVYCSSLAITRDMYSTDLKTYASGCTYAAIPPTSKKNNVGCTHIVSP